MADEHKDHTASHRENLTRNLARIRTMIHVAKGHGRKVRKALADRHKGIQDDIDYLQAHLHGTPGTWTSEDRADYERLLHERHRIDKLLAHHHKD